VRFCVYLQGIEKGMGLLHNVDTLYSGLGGYAGTGRRIDCGWTASLTGTWGARR